MKIITWKLSSEFQGVFENYLVSINLSCLVICNL